jgi:hypothetical protein
VTGYWLDMGTIFRVNECCVEFAENVHFENSNQQQEHSNDYEISSVNRKKLFETAFEHS